MLPFMPRALSASLPVLLNPFAAKPMGREVGAMRLDLSAKAGEDWGELPLHCS